MDNEPVSCPNNVTSPAVLILSSMITITSSTSVNPLLGVSRFTIYYHYKEANPVKGSNTIARDAPSALKVKVRAGVELMIVPPETGLPKVSKSVLAPAKLMPLSKAMLNAALVTGSMTGLLLQGGLADAVTHDTE